jgi:hypothetical protein
LQPATKVRGLPELNLFKVFLDDIFELPTNFLNYEKADCNSIVGVVFPWGLRAKTNVQDQSGQTETQALQRPPIWG